MNTARDHQSNFYRVYRAPCFPPYYDGSNRRRYWGQELRRDSHAESQVWKGHWKKQHQRFWVNKNNYRESYYDPWKEQMPSSAKVYNHLQQAQNGKGFLYQAYRTKRKPMLYSKISNKGTVNHFRPGRESRPDTHQDENQERMRTDFIEIG